MEYTDDLKVVFAVHDRNSSDRLRIMFVLQNQGAHDCYVTKVRLVREGKNGDFGEQTSDLLKLTRRCILYGSWEYGVLSVPDVSDISDTALRIEYLSNGVSRYTFCNMSEKNRAWSRCLLPSEDMGTLFMCFHASGSVPLDGVINCTVNGLAAKISDQTSLMTEDNRTLIAIEISTEQRFKVGDRVFVEALMPDGTSIGGATKLFYPFVLGRTQYERVLRVVEVSHENDWIRLSLYNEADFRKSPVVIEKVRLDGRDVTTTSQLPKGALPPDMHYYDRDKRNMVVHCAGDNAAQHHIEIDYRRLPPLFGQAPKGYFDKQTLSFCTLRGVKSEVDCGNGWGLSGGVCVEYGGLRPYPGLAEIRKRCAAIQETDPKLPVYALAAYGREPTAVSMLADCCDFAGVGQPLAASTPSFDRISVFSNYFRQMDGVSIPWAASLTPDAGTLSSPEDMEWLALSALSMGSHGFLLSPPDHGSEEVLHMCQDAVSGILQDVERLRPLLGLAQRVELRSTCNQDGIRTGFVLCGPSQLLVFAINEWCSRSSFQGKEPFMVVPRHDVEIAVNLGVRWKPKSAVVPFSGQPVSMALENDGQLRLQLPPFQIGQVVLLSRSVVDPSEFKVFQQPAISLCKYGRTRPRITHVSSPVLDLRLIRPGSEHELKISLKSIASRPITITGTSEGERDSKPGTVAVTTTTIAPRAIGEVFLTFKAPIVEGPSTTNVQLRSPDDPDFTTNAYICAEVEALARLEPSLLDFGSFAAQRGSKSQEVRVVSAEPTVRIGRVKVIGSVPMHVTKSDDLRSLYLNFKSSPEMASFASSLDVELISGDSNERLHETVYFIGKAVPTVSAAPSKLFVVATEQSRKYRVLIQHVEDQRVMLTNVAVEGFVQASADLGKFSRSPRVELIIQPGSKVGSKTTVRVEGVSEDGSIFIVSIPVVVLARNGESPSNPKNLTSSEHVGRSYHEGERN